MTELPPDASEAIVICTRNRPTELARTLQSVTAHPPSRPTFLAVVDASDPDTRSENRQATSQVDRIPAVHWSYRGQPSLARQRNYAINRLPPTVEIVHFVDDDVTVHPEYFDHLSRTIRSCSSVGGAGGIIIEPSVPQLPHTSFSLRRLFLLSHPERGCVLLSGASTPAQHPPPPDDSPYRTEWLSGCSSSYCRALLDDYRFDEALTGYSMLEDLDLSYRIAKTTPLLVDPSAQLTHRRSSQNQLSQERYAYAQTVHQRWFVDKHFEGSAARAAYWWSTAGRLLAICSSSHPDRREALRGLLRGIHAVWTRSHPLLKRPADQSGPA